MRNLVNHGRRAHRIVIALSLGCGVALLLPFVGNANAPIGRFEINSGTIYDVTTKLTWQGSPPVSSVTWQGAADYCHTLPLSGGHWRLPTRPELETLVDISGGREVAVDAGPIVAIPAIDPQAFPDTVGAAFWTSTPFAVDPPQGSGAGSAWVVDFGHGNSFD